MSKKKARLSADGADVDEISGGQRRRPGRLGDVGGQLQAVEGVPVAVAVAAQAAGAAAEVGRP
jgi:hypothetical protein